MLSSVLLTGVSRDVSSEVEVRIKDDKRNSSSRDLRTTNRAAVTLGQFHSHLAPILQKKLIRLSDNSNSILQTASIRQGHV